MKHEPIAANLVSDAESAAHTGLGLSMGLATTRLPTRFAMGLYSINDMIDAKFDHLHRPQSAS
jgi:hypothetical protein